MQRSDAIKKLGKLLGKSFGYRIIDKAASPDERAAAKLEIAAAVEERNRLKERRDARHNAILEADVEYQNLFAAAKAASDRVSTLQSITMHYKFTVGTSNGRFFHVKAEGDSWEDVITKIENQQIGSVGLNPVSRAIAEGRAPTLDDVSKVTAPND